MRPKQQSKGGIARILPSEMAQGLISRRTLDSETVRTVPNKELFMRIPRLVASVFFAITVSTAGWAQAVSSLHGIVQDQNGAVLPGATITLSNGQTGFSRTTKADNQGVYQFQQVPPATYQVTATATGFATLKQDNVVLLVNEPTSLNLTLPVQGQAVTVEVTSTTPPVNTVDATLGHAFDSRQVENLPFEGRDPAAILSLQPGVNYIGTNISATSDIDTRNGSVNGGRSDQANLTLDGVDNNDQVRGAAFQGAVRTTLESVEEFRVTTLGANADQGRSSGGQVALVTKSGTNQFHGSLYEYHRPTFTVANDWFNKQAQLSSGLENRPGKVIRNTFGGSLGGPILKNRLFFFGNYEAQRTAENQQVTRAVPGDTLRAGTISYPNANGGVTTLTAAQIASMDQNCKANGACPMGPGPNPAVLSVFNQYPRANSSSCPTADGFNILCYTFSAPNPTHLNTTVGKIDYNLNQSGTQHVFFRVNYQEDKTSQPPEFPGQSPALVERNNSRGLAASYNAAFTNTLVNSFRYGFSRLGVAQVGLQTQPIVEFRFIDDLIAPVANGTSTGTPGAPTRKFHVPVHNFVDDLTWTKGAHTFQFGTNLRRIDNVRDSNATSFNGALTNPLYLNIAPAGSGGSLDPGAFNFPAVDPNNLQVYDNAIIDLIGLMSQVTGNYNRTKTGAVLPQGQPVDRHFRAWEYEWYAQDAWRIKPNLTVTAGLRYTILEPPYEITGTQAAPNISMNNLVTRRGQMMLQGQVYNPIISFDLSGQANGKKPYWPYDYKDFAPRLAFAYSPNADSGIWHKIFGGSGKSSIRGGWGIVYDHFGQGVVSTFDENGTFGLTTSITNPASVQTVDGGARFTGLNNIPTTSHDGILLEPPPQGGFPATPPVSTPGNTFQQIAFGLDDHLRTPYSQTMDLSFTRELPHGFVVEANYVGRLGRRLLQQRDMEMPLNLVDPKSHTDYFSAATQFSKAFYAGTPTASIQPIPYWQNMFPTAAGTTAGSCLPGDVVPANPTATQAMYELYTCNIGPATFGETNALDIADAFCFPGCATINGTVTPFAFYSPQYSALYAWSSVANSSYHAGQLVLRSRQTHGLQFDFNYSYSHSIDEGSDAERVQTFGGLSAIINTWAPQQLKGASDFDSRHQINANWVYELPFGRGKWMGGGWSSVTNGFLGGWQVSGLLRWSSGLPFSITNGGTFPTNFQLPGWVFTKGAAPHTSTTFLPNPSAPGIIPDAFPQGLTPGIVQDFRYAYPGETGQRNNFRGDGYYGLDLGIAKVFKITERQHIKFDAEAFNLTNSARFDVASLNVNLQNSATFGQYGSLLTKPRVMQFALRYEF